MIEVPYAADSEEAHAYGIRVPRNGRVGSCRRGRVGTLEDGTPGSVQQKLMTEWQCGLG